MPIPYVCECGNKPTLMAGDKFFYKCKVCGRESTPFADPERAIFSWNGYISAEKHITRLGRRIDEKRSKKRAKAGIDPS